MNLRHLPTLICVLAMASAIGCGDSEPPTAAPEAHEPSPISEETTEDETLSTNASREQVVEAMTHYVAPFPQRDNLFAPPSYNPTGRGDSLSLGSVQLRGIADLGEPQAILHIEGTIALVPVGHEKHGVKVVAIDHQKVTLRRGDNQWTASLD